MFEQIQAADAGRKSMAVILSATLQTAAAGAAVLLSIIHFQTLDLRGLIEPPPLFAPRLNRVTLVPTEQYTGRPRVAVVSTPTELYAPRQVPQGIARIDDIGSAPVIGISPEGFIPSEFGERRGIPHSAGNVLPPPPPAEPSVKPGERQTATQLPRVRIGGDVLEAKIIHRVIPIYPPLAKQTRTQGVVKLMAVIGKDGTVQNLQVVSGHPLLVKAAVDAVQQWLYRPTLLNGDPVEVSAPIEVRFVLQ
jgi:protein TonB